MIIYENLLYNQDIAHVTEIKFPWYKLQNRSIMISGATGLIGSFLIDVLLEKNTQDGLNCTVYALGRNKEKAMERFSKHANNSHLIFIPYDVRLPLKIDNVGRVDYVLHLAANTHPMLYATDPIGTITTNLIGAQNMLEFSAQHNAVRFLLASSNEMYGENRGDVEFYDEDYCGYINCNTLRAGYPESKRCSEALCQAYKQQKGLDVVIARLTRSYGPTMNMSDTKAVSQFIKRGVAGEDIILKSEGTQYFSYTYMSDAVSGLLWVLLTGENASSSIVCHPPIVYTEDMVSGVKDIDREHVMLTASPQVYNYELVLKYYEKAERENEHNFTFTSSLLIHYGERVYFAKGTTNNIKITKKEDLALFEALLSVPEELLYS